MAVERREVIWSTEQTKPGNLHTRVLDPNSGEILLEQYQETKRKPSGRPPDGKQPQFIKVYRTNWKDIVDHRRLTFTEAGVLMHLLAYVDWESNWLVHPKTGANLNESALAGLPRCDRSTLHKALDGLNKKGLIAIVKRGEGCPNHILFNSNVAFFGKYLRNQRDHETFADNAYKPVVTIKYKEPPATK